MSDLFSIAGRVGLVTGGSNGIGLMIARGLVQAGVKTYIVARNGDKARHVADALTALGGGSCHVIAADLASMAGVSKVVTDYGQCESRLDILVNNAGVLFEMGIDDYTEEAWDATLDLNLKTVFFLTQKLLPVLRASGTRADPARVINISSADSTQLSEREHYGYVASKAALNHLTRALAKRLAREHITVNAIAPGPFPSDMTAGYPQEVIDAVANLFPLNRFGAEEDIAGTVIYLASRAGAFLTGTVTHLDGGWTGCG